MIMVVIDSSSGSTRAPALGETLEVNKNAA
jgi:hypothetical protein